MTERLQCEFFLVRYVPDTVKNEFVNIGVVLRSVDSAGRPLVRFTRDWSRLRCVDPDADLSMLEALEEELQSRMTAEDVDAPLEMKPLAAVLADSFSNMLQVTNPRACLAESMIAELENLMRIYIEPRPRAKRSKRSGRVAIHAAMRTQFERARVWSLLNKRIAAAAYTKPGDPLHVDCGYRPNGVVRMFHAVSLEAESETAKILAFTMPELRAGVARVENASLELTAIIEPLLQICPEGTGSEVEMEYRFAVETMESRDIRVMTTSDLSRIAATAQRELRVE